MPDRPDSDATGAYQPPSPMLPAERFPPGLVLGGRYRIVAPLGKGGMGEVYRADDLTLGQPVALKFLPPHLSTEPDRLSRFRKEVAAARRVSHPNVCRVYDIADHDGQPFLTMEFVDGEDLSSLLRRVGRLPEEKGTEIARQLCSALAAVHDQGLLHRDLKPANVMLDGRGKVRLTDFGLAAAAQDLSATEVRSGTPLYMAPEQMRGTAVTVRSDLFSLGLVLYELFTGRRPFPDANRDAAPSKPSSHVSGLSPAVEQVILQCLEADPVRRPRSAAEVLARLPGGDPLAAALAAGETPSPRLVAEANAGNGQLRPGVALALVGVVVAGVLICGWLGGFALLAPRTGMRDAEPALMRHKAREVLATLGHDEPAGDSSLRYYADNDFEKYARTIDPEPDRWDGRWRGLEDGRPPAMVAHYRAARGPLAPTNWYNLSETPGTIAPASPPPLEPGMVDVALDMRGRLLLFRKVADFRGPASPPGPVPATDWGPALGAAGLNQGAFMSHPVQPRHRPQLAADAWFAWEGPYPGRTFDRVRVEAASLQGRPVYFTVEFPWQADKEATYRAVIDRPLPVVAIIFVYGLPLAAVGLALWNWRVGRADLVGAAKLGGFLLVLWVVRWALTAHHVNDEREVAVFEYGLGLGVHEALLAAVFYLALEPIVRKRWPWQLVGWTRLLAGRVRDPLVARDVLVGLAAGVVFAAGSLHFHVGPAWAPELIEPIWFGDYEMEPARCVVNPLTTGLRVGFVYFFLTFLCHWVLRNRWVGGAAVVLLIEALFLTRPDLGKPVTTALTVFAVVSVLQFVPLRYGLLAFATAFVTYGWLALNGWSLDVRAWYATGPNLGVAVLLALTGYAAYTATGGALGRPLRTPRYP